MALAYQGAAQTQTYRRNAVLGMTPGQLTLKLYDMLVRDLEFEDTTHASKVLAELIESLDFRYEQPAAGLFRLYRFCMEQVKHGRCAEPLRIARELRDTWAQAIATSG